MGITPTVNDNLALKPENPWWASDEPDSEGKWHVYWGIQDDVEFTLATVTTKEIAEAIADAHNK